MQSQMNINEALDQRKRPPITCDAKDNRFILQWSGDQAGIFDLLRSQLNAQLDKQTKTWWCSRNPNTLQVLQRLNVEFTQSAQDAIFWMSFDAEKQGHQSSSGATDFQVQNWRGVPLRMYQNAGVEYFTNCERGILADDMGTGKTMQVLALAQHNDAFPALVICPAKLKGNWEEEITLTSKANITGREVFTVTKAKDIEHSCQDQLKLFEYNHDCPGCRFDAADLVITNYEQYCDGWLDSDKLIPKLSRLAQRVLERQFKLVGYDEAHALKNWDSQRTKAVKQATRGIKFKIAMSGTPVINDKEELLCLLSVTETLHHFGGSAQFRADFIDAIPSAHYQNGRRYKRDYETIKRLTNQRDIDLSTKLKQVCMLRRQKKDVAAELPPKVRQTFYVTIDNDADYKLAKNKLLEWVRNRVLEDRKFLDSISQWDKRTQQAMIAQRQNEKEDSAMRGEYMVRLMALRRVIAEGKLTEIKAWIDNFRKTKQKLLVFAIHQDILNTLLSWYPKAARILSSTKDVKDQVRLFQEDPSTDIFIGAMGTHVGASPAGTGHTLTAGNHVLFVEHGFTAAHITQCEDRAHRIGSELWGHESINIYHPLARRPSGRNTIEVSLARIIDAKRELAERVVDGIMDSDELGIMMSLYDELLEDDEDD